MNQEDGSGNVQLERQVRQATVLKIVAGNGMVDIDSDTDRISFGWVEGMYRDADGSEPKPGYGCQVDDEARRGAVEKMCFRIAEAMKDYLAETA
jgi:hypothetical protein